MKKNGFTLVELLGVIVIIGVLMLLALNPILGQIRNNSSKLSEASLKILYSSTEQYLDEHSKLYPKNDGMIYYIPVGQLVDSEVIKQEFLSTYSDKVLSEESVIKINVVNGGYTFSLVSDDIDNLADAYSSVGSVATYSYLGGTYIAGATSANYVYYSGMMWRIVGENKDGSIKLISDEIVTTMNFGGNTDIEKNDVMKWLNNYLYSHLSFSDFLLEENWCTATSSTTTNSSDACLGYADDAFYMNKIGLIDLFQYNLSNQSGDSFINNGFPIDTMTTNNTSFYEVAANKTISAKSIDSIIFVRPVINLSKYSIVNSGSGTSADPYILFKDQGSIFETSNISLNQANISCGNYVKIGTNTFRVVESSSKDIKLSLNSTTDSQAFNTDPTYNNQLNLNSGIGNYLNFTFYDSNYASINSIVLTFWYQGSNTYSNTVGYKNTYLAKQNMVSNIRVGLPKLGEILTAPIYGGTTNSFWTMTKISANNLAAITTTGGISSIYSTLYSLRPVIIIDGKTIIKNGKGTAASPYEI